MELCGFSKCCTKLLLRSTIKEYSQKLMVEIPDLLAGPFELLEEADDTAKVASTPLSV